MADRLNVGNQPSWMQQPRESEDVNSLAQTEGMTLESVRTERGPALTAEIAPLPTAAQMNAVGADRGVEDMRLNPPVAASPYGSSPLGAKQDVYLMASFLRRSAGPDMKALSAGMESVTGVPDNVMSFVRAAHARLNRLADLTKQTNGMADEVMRKVREVTGS